MIQFPRISVVLGGVLAAGAVLGMVLQPRHYMAEDGPKVDLERLVPKEFGRWKVDPRVRPVQASPDVEAGLKRTYDQVLERTYVDDRRHQIMVSLVYGLDELTEALAAHRPENCYFTQGFQIVMTGNGSVSAGGAELPMRRVVAVRGERQEPITYWMTIGHDVVVPGLTRRLTQAKYGLTGRIPDGVLLRVSSIGGDWDGQFLAQAEFLAELIAAIPVPQREKLAGS